MTKSQTLTLIFALIIINVAAVTYLALQYYSASRPVIFQPSDEINEFGYSDADADQEQALQANELNSPSTASFSEADCKVTYSDCRLTCQADWESDPASSDLCFSDCQQSWQFCTSPPS